MSSSSLAEVLTGAAFGSSLYLAGVYSPSIIVQQLQWTNLHMLETFMTASAIGAIVFRYADSTGRLATPTRKSREMGVFPYDGNVLGGAMIGAGMALTGACPGTALVQTVAGVQNGKFVLAGGVLGGLLYNATGLSDKVKTSTHSPATVSSVFGVNANIVTYVWEAFCIAAIGGCVLFDPRSSQQSYQTLVSPIFGGVLIGLAQALSVFLSHHSIGVSAAFGDIGSWANGHIKKARGHSSTSPAGLPLTPSVLFSLGIASGVALMARTWSAKSLSDAETNVSSLTAFVGGLVMIIGARIAAGCTSGHGISGMSTFSISSFLTVAAMFGTGTVVALSSS